MGESKVDVELDGCMMVGIKEYQKSLPIPSMQSKRNSSCIFFHETCLLRYSFILVTDDEYRPVLK